MNLRAAWTACFALGLSALGCVVEEQRYVIENEAVALVKGTAPAFTTQEDQIFVVTRDFELPITPPKSGDLARLMRDAQGKNLPFPRAPWVEDGDLDLQLDYVLANQGDRELLVSVVLNGRNEFNLYTPGPEDFNQWERRFLLKGKERVHGTVTELEMQEIGVDLATVVNGAPNSNEVVQFQSQSGRDPRTRPYIPKLVPGLVGFSAGIMTTLGEDEELTDDIVLEISVRAQDHGNRLAARGERRWMLPEPVAFVPVVEDEEQ